ncbi:zinc-binding dehydrogenase [Bradyrhizobium sp. cf659]|uniref:zinc-binding dehydrogenase n=1 Tax=Bradyrhizobium sp. cf659 TaxID=1761771 RepID=UPI0008F3870C|nr:zinc-binding dehydrogenase [Bradyrhizobium sp. cf659]SFJ71177.1 S-(hydroxymethyl)mycothiol dehydrogenase [Bradyrhizobium sp. cf659]
MTQAIVGYPGSNAPVLTNIIVPAPVGHQALVEVIASGICHSQLNQLDQLARTPDGAPGRLLGHEALGIVTETGPHVSAVKRGDTVIMSWLPRREYLGSRRVEPVTLTVDGRTVATPDIFTWAERTVADEAYLYPTSSSHPALSVLGCAVVTGAGAVMNSARIKPGDTVAVIGTGGVGGAAIVAARAMGASEIFAIDLNEDKLALAHQLGATQLINTARAGLVETMAQWADAKGASGVDHVIDCVAAPPTFSDALAIVRKGRAGFGPGGTVVVVGVAHRPAELDLRFIQLHGITIKGCFGGDTQGDRDVATYVDWFDDASVGLRALVTHSYALGDAMRAVDELRNGKITGRAIFAIAPNCAAI